MDDLFPALFLLIGAIVSIVSSAKKEKEKKAAEEHRRAAAAARVRAAQQTQKASAPAKPIPAPAAPLQVAQPQVHVHVQPECGTHDAPGSLGVASPEGKDPCHEAQLTHPRTATEVPQEEGGLTLEWSGENMVKAFIMQEVLTRPASRAPTCQRRAR